MDLHPAIAYVPAVSPVAASAVLTVLCGAAVYAYWYRLFPQTGLRSAVALPSVEVPNECWPCKPLAPAVIPVATLDHPISVNYHFTRECNYNCGFCFHTQTNRKRVTLDDAKTALRLLREAGCLKINFAGGEPFLFPKHLGAMVLYCKHELKFPSVSIISNGSKITNDWFHDYASGLDMLGISCDSFNDATNAHIGRTDRKERSIQTQHVLKVADLCREYGIKFKLNTVVNAFNVDEDMTRHITALRPDRWKVFQVLPIEGENSGMGAKRNVKSFVVSAEHFERFLARHRATDVLRNILKAEDNSTMQSSYVLLDEDLRFLDSSTGGKIPTASILTVGVEAAWRQLLAGQPAAPVHHDAVAGVHGGLTPAPASAAAGFDLAAFERREGVFNWSREQSDPRARPGPHVSSGCASGGAGAEDIEDLFSVTRPSPKTRGAEE